MNFCLVSRANTHGNAQNWQILEKDYGIPDEKERESCLFFEAGLSEGDIDEDTAASIKRKSKLLDKEYLERTERSLINRLAERMEVPYSMKGTYLGSAVRLIADKKSTTHDDRRQKRCIPVFAFISLFSQQFLAARPSLPFQSNTPHRQECLTMRRIPLYNTLRVIQWWRRCVTCIFQVETYMDILSYPIAITVAATIVIEKILI